MKNKLLTLFLALAASVGTLFAETYSGTCGTNLTWTFDTESGTLTISGNGAMMDYTSNSMPWYSYSSSIKTVIIEDGVTSIGNYAFIYCSSLTSVTIPNSVTSIRDYAFSNCSSLASVTIGESVSSIGTHAFKGCSKLATVIWNAKKINDFSSSNTPFYISGISYYDYNFDLRKQITSFTFGDNVESIPAYLCSGMSNLTSVTIPNSVTSIGDYAFSNCKIDKIYFSGTMEEWCTKSFFSSSISSSYTLYINSEAVSNAVIPNSVTSIEDYTFYGCSSLTSITIPNSVTSIGEGAFFSCDKLTAVNISDIAAWCKIAFSDYNANPLYYAHNLYLNGTLVTDLVIPDGVTSIGNYAFRDGTSLTSIEIPNSVKSIGQSAFAGCTYLDNIVIGSGVTSNGIGSGAFANCPYLMSVTCKAIYPPVISSGVFEGCGVLGGIDLYVPEKSVARYKKADVWSEFNIIGKDLSVDDPTNPTNPEDGKYTITWQDEDGNVIKTDQVAQGTTPAFTGTTPTKEGYDFAGWLPNIKPATEDTKYTTYFIPTQQTESKVYTVNINGENCSLNINNQYPEGTVITLEAVADECFEFQQWSDGNKDNPRTITVTANTNLTAEFNKVRYTVTGQPSTGGKVQIRKQ